MKRNRYALDAHAALLAPEHNVAQQSHLADLYVLAELCDALYCAAERRDAMTGEVHIKQHCDSVRRLCNEIHDADYACTPLRYAAMEASANLLLGWFERQPNAVIARTAIRLRGKLAA